ncbi:hypothetical protein [Actinoplanes sp. NPDC051411]|uniref:hypothetical protein n=1 Tax=Actinoplanes sp. NPDC051411 TaxID=3155522 RepID=UPI00341506DB
MPADFHLHLRDAGTWDAAAVVDVLAAAITTTSLARWMVPAPDARGRHLQTRLDGIVTRQITARRVRVADDGGGQITGALVWTTCDHASGAARPDPAAVLADTDGDAQRSRLLQAQLAYRHPARPHHHLIAIGVRPGRHRRGIGAALIDDWHHQVHTPPADTYLLAPDTLLGLARNAGYHTLGEPISPMVTAPPLYVLARMRPAGEVLDSAAAPAAVGAGAARPSVGPTSDSRTPR